MSFKEVNALRKAGQLGEATAMARADIANLRDKWSCNALFWCLNDKAQNANMEELQEIVEEMRSLMETIGNEEIPTKSLNRLESRLIPHAAEVRQASEDAKTPQLARGAYQLVAGFYNAGELADRFHIDFGWIIYRAIKASDNKDTAFRNEVLNTYLQLEVERPSILHSLILGEAIKTEKEGQQEFSFVEFIEGWGLDNLRGEDWEQFVTEDNTKVMSKVEKMIYLYTKEVCSNTDIEPSKAFVEVLDKAIAKWAKDDNLVRCRAMMFQKVGNMDSAISLYKKAIMLTSGQKGYLWKDLANLVGDEELQIGLLSKALMLHNPEEFLGKTRLQLATHLCRRGLFANAKHELDKVQQLYESQGWRLPSEHYLTMRNIPANVVAEDNTPKYAVWAIKADEYMYSSLPSTIMVKVAQRVDTIERPGQRPKRVEKWTLLDQCGNVITINPKKFNLHKTDAGCCFEVKQSNNLPVAVLPTSYANIEWIKEVSGAISIRTNREGKRFGLLENCYVHNKYLGDMANGANVSGVAILKEGKWSMISLYRVE